MVVDDKKLEKILQAQKPGHPGGLTKHKNLVRPVHALYDAGLSVKQIEKILRVSKKWIRTRLQERAKSEAGFKMRPPGRYTTKADLTRVKKILKTISVEDVRPEVQSRKKGKRR